MYIEEYFFYSILLSIFLINNLYHLVELRLLVLNSRSVIMPSSTDHHHHHQKQQQQLPMKSPRIKQDDKFFSRLLSKETSQPNSSCRIYYGEAAGAIPFVWESQPGTPKHTFETSSLPPLTPPPSYSTTINNKISSSKSKPSKPRPLLLLTTIIFWKKTKSTTGHNNKLSQPSSSSLSSLSSSSSLSSWSISSSNYSVSSSKTSSKQKVVQKRRRFFSDYSTVDSSESPTSTLCFPVMRKKSYWNCVSVCYVRAWK